MPKENREVPTLAQSAANTVVIRADSKPHYGIYLGLGRNINKTVLADSLSRMHGIETLPICFEDEYGQRKTLGLHVDPVGLVPQAELARFLSEFLEDFHDKIVIRNELEPFGVEDFLSLSIGELELEEEGFVQLNEVIDSQL